MKTTIDIPDELYRRVKAKSALEGRSVREVSIELYQRWLEEEPTGKIVQDPEEWLRAWLALADEEMRDEPPAPIAREILAEDRNRLDPR